MASALQKEDLRTSYAVRDIYAFVDALPCAAAVFSVEGGKPEVLRHNAAYRAGTRVYESTTEIPSWHDRIAAVIRTGKPHRSDWRNGSSVEQRYFDVTVAALDASHALVTLVDRTNEVMSARSLRTEMLTDSLTGLRNRLAFVEHMEVMCADAGCIDYAVILVDLARFSRVNECIGSLGGDELIMTVARRLMSALRGHDEIARTGANEFALAVKIIDGPGDALHVARRIEGVMAQTYRLSDFEMKVDCAIGCALASEADGDAEQLMRHAQIALKTAKVSTRIEFYQPSALAAARRHFIIETELRRALERNALTLAFQPLMSLKTGQVVGFEALARWKHPVMGVIAPDEFIATAEESGLIVPLGRWALDNALRTLRVWDLAAGTKLPLSMAVNLSAIQIARDDVAKFVEAGLRDHGIRGSRLTVELTESAIIADPERAARTLNALKACSAMVAMDDFGTGFSNLAALQRLPIDTLKIDRSFITGMIGDVDKVAIVRAILSLAHALGMATTAEGIETLDLADTLAGLGCTTGQGFLYAEALTADEAFSFAMKSLGTALG